MSDLPKHLWHDGWTQEDWDTYCRLRVLVGILLLVAAARFLLPI